MFFSEQSSTVPLVTSFRTALFDLDGTLLDHFAAIHRTHAYTMQQLGLPPPTMKAVRNAIGGGLEIAIQRLVGPHNEALIAEAVPIYRAYWQKTMLHGVALLPGAQELLEALKARGTHCAVFTNKHGPSARIVCEHLGITPFLDEIFGAFDTPWLKPDREFAHHALATLRAQPETACLIGDSPYDIEAARNASFPCYCVTTGTHTAEELQAAGASGIYDDLFAVGREVFGLPLPPA